MIRKTEKFKERVLKELTLLRTQTSEIEKRRLHKPIYGWDSNSCVYGQLASYSASARGLNLKQLCGQRFYGSHQPKIAKITTDFSGFYYTDLEVYLCMDGANLEDIPKFIKGEIEAIEL